MLNLNVGGRPAHAGMNHDKGRSAIREMAHQVLALEAMTDYERGITVSVGTARHRHQHRAGALLRGGLPRAHGRGRDAACASCAPWVRTWSWTSTSS